MSDVPIRFSKELRKRMIASQKVKGAAGYLGLLSGLKLAHLAPEARRSISCAGAETLQLPAIAEYSSAEVMGHSADRLCSYFGVTRAEQVSCTAAVQYATHRTRTPLRCAPTSLQQTRRRPGC